MRFKTRKDLAFNIFTSVMCGALISILIFRISTEGYSNLNFIFLDILILGSVFLLGWIYFDTEYELSESELKYKSGPIRGSISIDSITEIIVGETLWAGIKPATALNGLIITHEKSKKVYISPDTNEAFVRRILEKHSDIKISYK